MDLQSFHTGLHIAATQGLTLNLYERASLDVALSALKRSERSSNDPFFWGKLLGSEDDYYVAYFTDEAASTRPHKKFFYSTRAFRFRPLPTLTANQVTEFQSIRSVSFTGNPAALVNTGEEGGSGAGLLVGISSAADSEKDAESDPTENKLTELHVLSGLVKKIDFGTAVVPRGSYIVKNNNTVTPSPDFRAEALRRLAADDYQFHADSFDSLQGDNPKGSWVFRHDPVTGAVILRSLLWPGYVAYGVLNTTKFGSIYIGTGKQNLDLPFLLP